MATAVVEPSIFQTEIQRPESSTQTRTLTTGQDVRLACRTNTIALPTSGLAPGYLQANLIVLPSRYASDFRLLCARNPVPCPLIAESAAPGSYDRLRSHIPGAPAVAADLDLRRDAPAYMVYRGGKLIKSHAPDVEAEWTRDHVAFLVGCSFSFESALAAAGLPARHAVMGRNVPVYRTAVPLCPAGVFAGGAYVVSMRPYPASCVDRVREVTRRYGATHGEPIAWGWDAVRRLGIQSIDQTQWGDAPLMLDGRPLGQAFGSDEEVPVFWGCGVTPQEAVMRAGAAIEGTVMAHAPGYMLVVDSKDEDVVQDE
ncbi:DUF1445 domain-containing protein [Truncatella angustata]|uniref:DUF1445 domain-containing protein n=1 Tax=Truncatella angustata TaxID=152316 RepID=A0A9P8UQS1_9PEZI|nr:DUF1445 domain-containing protein [Truncatella angustata]KAH6656392.1 DUF1445 domain-containing protein [Truncatella angustata]KAH8196640.1 hypothetical protein TruAng_009199 [Truncatella angustata]